MMKRILATSALATLLATGIHAQTTPTPDPMTTPAAPAEGAGDATTMPAEEGVTTTPDVVEDGTMAPGAADTETAAPGMDGMDADPMEGWEPADLAALSSDQLIGSDIVTYDNETVASIEDVLITDDGQVESIVARFGGFLGFGSDLVLLTLDKVEVLQDADDAMMVRTNLTPESIESRPVYEETAAPG